MIAILVISYLAIGYWYFWRVLRLISDVATNTEKVVLPVIALLFSPILLLCVLLLRCFQEIQDNATNRAGD